MTEPTLFDRVKMIVRTVAGIVTWVVAILVKIVRGIVPDKRKEQVQSQDDTHRG